MNMNHSILETMRNLIHLAFRPFLLGLVLICSVNDVLAQDDGIYEDIYQSPPIDEETPNVDPLGGYSTYDQNDYYQSNGSSSQAASESGEYIDDEGNTYVTNNYYDEDYDYIYASRINRFHRPIYGFGYYDPFYTNMYWYNNDPFYFGTSIYANWGWNNWYSPWGWNSWGWGVGFNSWGFNSWGYGGGWGYSPYCYGGGLGYGWNGYSSGYNHGYWNGYYDGLAYGNGYYNTYDQNSGIYYGHRGGSAGTSGSGMRSSSFADRYNSAASTGLVSHANRGNVLQSNDAKPVQGLTSLNEHSTGRNNDVVKPRINSDRNDHQQSKAPVGRSETPLKNNEDGRSDVKPSNPLPNRSLERYSTPSSQGRVPVRQDSGNMQNAPQRNPQVGVQTPQRIPQSSSERAPQRTPIQNVDKSRPNVNQVPARNPQQQGNRDVYQRGGTPSMSRPSYQSPAVDRQSRSMPDQPSRNYIPTERPVRQTMPSPSQPSREIAPMQSRPQQRNVAPSRSEPSRNYSPSRGVSPTPAPSRGGSFSSPSGGGNRGGSSGRRGG
jgi:hypothetical protein